MATKQLFNKNVLQTYIQLTPEEYNEGIDDIILEKLKDKVEGKCDNNGFINHDSTVILKRSMGEIQQGQFNGSCVFKVVYSVDICSPVEGMIIKCVVRNINKMGLFCELAGFDPSPLSLILAKQHHLKNADFEKVKPNDIINVEIIGVKIEYNEEQITCIGVLADGNITHEDDDESELDDYNESVVDQMTEEEIDLDEESANANEVADANANEVEVAEPTHSSQQSENVVVNEALMITPSVVDEEETIEPNLDMELVEGVQDLEKIDLDLDDLEEVSDLQAQEAPTDKIDDPEQSILGGESDLDELGEEFEAETLDLDEISRKDIIPIYNKKEVEEFQGELGKEVFDLDILSSNKYKTFSKPRKNSKKYINYFIYVQLNNLMIEFYQKNGKEPKKVRIGNNNRFNKEIREYLEKNGKSLLVEATDELTHVV